MIGRIEEFTYQKEDYTKEYRILVLEENENYLKGISLNDLDEDDLNEILSLWEQYEAKIKECAKKYFRQFKKEKILIDLSKKEKEGE